MYGHCIHPIIKFTYSNVVLLNELAVLDTIFSDAVFPTILRMLKRNIDNVI